MTKNKDYEKSETQKLKDRLERMRGELRRQKKLNKELLHENETLKSAWKKTENFLKEVTDDVPLEELLKQRTLPKKAVRKRVKKEQKPKEDLRDTWMKTYRSKNDEMD